MTATKEVKKIKKETPSKIPLKAVKFDKKDAEGQESEAVSIPKKKKKSGIVALKYKRVLDRIGEVRKHKTGKQHKRVTLYQALIDEGYSESYARAGGNLKHKPTWDQLLEQRLGDDKLSNIHAQLLTSKKLDYMLFTSEIEDIEVYALLESVGCTPKKIIHGIAGVHVWFWAPDNKTRKDALELAHKIRGKMSPEVIEFKTDLEKMGDAELAEIIKKQKAKFTKKD